MSDLEWLELQKTLLIYLLFFSIIASLVAWKIQFFYLPHEKALPRIPFLKVLGAFAIYLISQILIIPAFLLTYSLSGLLTDKKFILLSSDSLGWLQAITILFSSLLLFVYLKKRGENILEELSFSKRSFLPFFYGLASSGIALPIVKLIGSATALFSYYFFGYVGPEQLIIKILKGMLNTPLLFSITAFAIVFFIPFVEEVLFRGFLHNWLKQKGGKKLAYILSALIFSLFHYEYSLGIGNLEILVTLFFIGLFLSHLKEKKQTLWAPVGLHAAINALSIIALLLGFESV